MNHFSRTQGLQGTGIHSTASYSPGLKESSSQLPLIYSGLAGQNTGQLGTGTYNRRTKCEQLNLSYVNIHKALTFSKIFSLHKIGWMKVLRKHIKYITRCISNFEYTRSRRLLDICHLKNPFFIWTHNLNRTFLWEGSLLKLRSIFAVVFQSLSCVWLFVTPWTATHQTSLSFTIAKNLLIHMSIELVITIQPSHLLPFPSLPAFNLSQHRVFSNESALHIRWPNYWSFSFSISPSNEYSGLMSFRIDWFDLLAVQGTLKILQYHSSKASDLQCSTLFLVQISHTYVTTSKTIDLIIGTLLAM